MKFMAKMERKFGRYAIYNLSVYMICCMVIGYVIELVSPQMFMFLTLEPALIVRGQVWRLFTWILIPPATFDFFTIIMLILYYQLGKILESSIGVFRYNIFMFGGVLFTPIFSMIAYGIGVATGTPMLFNFYYEAQYLSGVSVYYTCLTIYMAIAVLFPNMQLYLYFLIPIRMKWLLVVYSILTAVEFYNGIAGIRIAIVAAMLNFLLFILINGRHAHINISPAEIKRRQTYQKQVRTATEKAKTTAGATRHKCAVCGRTEEDGDDLVFRYCTKCNGAYEYCQDHLFTHTHVE